MQMFGWISGGKHGWEAARLQHTTTLAYLLADFPGSHIPPAQGQGGKQDVSTGSFTT